MPRFDMCADKLRFREMPWLPERRMGEPGNQELVCLRMHARRTRSRDCDHRPYGSLQHRNGAILLRMKVDPATGANSIAEALILLGLLAAPRILAQHPTSGATLRTCLPAAIDWLAQVRTGSGDATNDATRRLLTAELQLRALFALLDSDGPPSAGCTEIARACLAAQGIAEPPGGWDAFEGHV